MVFGPLALVARPVNKMEMLRTPAAEAAVAKEWERLRLAGAWDESSVQELTDLKASAKRTGKRVHIGRIFELCHEKGSELPEGHPGRKFKGRVVFMGNQVRDEENNVAIFNELSSAPATMEAAKAADIYSLLPGHAGQTADGDMAYIQARLEGTETWVLLPKHRWPPEWSKRGFTNPVCRLVLALYGHPDSGGYWEKKFNRTARKGGWKPIEYWPSCFFHPELLLVLVVYVDDFKMSGPLANLSKGWSTLRGEIKMGEPEPIGKYLGCEHQLLEADDLRRLANAVEVNITPQSRGLVYDMGGFLSLAVARYQQLAGPKGAKLKRVPSPFVDSQALDVCYDGSQDCLEFEDDQGGHPISGSRTPPDGLLRKPSGALGSKREPVRLITKAERSHSGAVATAAARKIDRAQLWAERAKGKSSVKTGTFPTPAPRGELASIAASVLMQVLFAARMARPDLLKAINYLARRITVWTELCDKLLHRLMCYINSTLDLAMVSIVGDPAKDLRLELFVDSDFAGDPNSKFSTSGVWFGVGGPHTRACLCCLSKRQTSRAFSTPEAEIVAYALGLRTEGLPGLDLWESILQRRVELLLSLIHI